MATSITEHVRCWFNCTTMSLADPAIDDSEVLQAIGADLSALALDPLFEAALPDCGVHCPATIELGRCRATGAAMYLMTDPEAARSAAHRHDTWAVTIGLAGVERNVMYRHATSAPPSPARCTIDVRRETILCMTSGEGHSTEAVDGPTRMLHLFGRSLDDLAPFDQRLLHLS